MRKGTVPELIELLSRLNVDDPFSKTRGSTKALLKGEDGSAIIELKYNEDYILIDRKLDISWSIPANIYRWIQSKIDDTF